jgi:hypothetical protein
MPWKPGQSGNPGGKSTHRPRNQALNIIREFQRLGGKNGRKYALRLHEIAMSPNSSVQEAVKALGLILAYMFGRPSERVEVNAQVRSMPLTVIHEFYDPASGALLDSAEVQPVDPLRLAAGGLPDVQRPPDNPPDTLSE